MMAAKPTICPPHRWVIELVRTDSGRAETWTCSQCGEVQLVERENRGVWGTSAQRTRAGQSGPPHDTGTPDTEEPTPS